MNFGCDGSDGGKHQDLRFLFYLEQFFFVCCFDAVFFPIEVLVLLMETITFVRLLVPVYVLNLICQNSDFHLKSIRESYGGSESRGLHKAKKKKVICSVESFNVLVFECFFDSISSFLQLCNL